MTATTARTSAPVRREPAPDPALDVLRAYRERLATELAALERQIAELERAG